MKTIIRILTIVSILFAYQCNMYAQSYILGIQKEGFSYNTLYANRHAEDINTTTVVDIHSESPQAVVVPKTPKLTDTYKKEVMNHMIQVQQQYAKLELNYTPTFSAYKKAVSKVMTSRKYNDWATLEAINALMDNLTKEDCTIDKSSLDSQLAEKTTPEEIIEVFKQFLPL